MKLLKRITILLTTLVLTLVMFLDGQANLSVFNLYNARADEIQINKGVVINELKNSSYFRENDYSIDFFIYLW